MARLGIQLRGTSRLLKGVKDGTKEVIRSQHGIGGLIVKKGLGLLGRRIKRPGMSKEDILSRRIKRPGMSKEDKIKTGAVAATGAAITGLGVLKAKSELDKDYGVTKKPKYKKTEDKK